MMDGCIKLDALLSAAKDYDWISGLKTVLKRIPIADTVEVVRCKDCRFFHNGYDEKCCTNHKGVVVTDENGFCHHAIRRADNR